MSEINHIIRRYRKLSGMTQTEFASKVGCSIKHINRIENGVIYPNWKMFLKILDALGLGFQVKKKVLIKDFDHKNIA